MTMTMPRVLTRDGPAAAPDRLADTGKPPRGSAQRAAVLTLTAAVIFQPMLHPSGPGNSSPVDLLTVASIITAGLWLVVTHRKIRAPYVIPVLLYAVAGLASGLVGFLQTTAMLTVLQDLLLFGWCLAAVNVLSAPRAMRVALKAWSYSAIFWASLVIVGWLGHITFLEGLNAAEGNRVMFTFGDPNYASWYWAASILVLYASRTPKRRWTRLAGYVALVWVLILSESNGGILSLLLAIFLLLLLRIYRRRGLVGVAATVLAVGVTVGGLLTAFPLNSIRHWAATSNQPLLVNSIGRSAQSSSERSLLEKEAIQLYQRSDGILGLGPASTKPLLGQWLYPYANEAHDDYLAALVERGSLGLFAFLLLVASAASRASPIIRRPLSAPFAAAVPRPAGLVAALFAVSFNSLYEETQHFRVWWLLLGIVAVLGWDACRNRTQDVEPQLQKVEAANGG